MAHNDEHSPADAGGRVRSGWSGDAIVHDQDHHQQHPERTGWNGDDVVHDQDHHQRHPERTEWSGDEVVHDQTEAHSSRSR